jgi:hypothetical protein
MGFFLPQVNPGIVCRAFLQGPGAHRGGPASAERLAGPWCRRTGNEACEPAGTRDLEALERGLRAWACCRRARRASARPRSRPGA